MLRSIFSGLLSAAFLLSPLPAFADGCGYSSYGYGSYGGGYGSNYGNWSYSPYYRQGYSYYSAGYGYPAGYWYYNQPNYYPYKVVPIYIPTAFTTYSPAALVSRPLAALEQTTAVQASGFGVGAIAAVPTVSVGSIATVTSAVAVDPRSPSKCDQALSAFDARLARIEKALMGGGGDSPPNLPPVPKAATAKPKAEPKAEANDRAGAITALVEKGKGVFVAKCAKCHAKADATAGKPQLFDGANPKLLDCQTLSDCQSAVLEGSMPPAAEDGSAKLGQDEGQALVAYFVSLSRANKKAARAAMPPAK